MLELNSAFNKNIMKPTTLNIFSLIIKHKKGQDKR